MEGTNLAQAVEVAKDAESYDANVKFLLADKQVLARILKYALKDFQDMGLEDIMSSIGESVEVGTKPIDAGLSNLGRVSESNTEDNIPGEGKIFYDIRFSAYKKQEEIKILINIEAQKSSDPHKLGYHLENRIIFYLARMVSAQKQTEFYHSDYDSLKRVRSIWICMDNGEEGDSIEEISLGRSTVFGKAQKLYQVDLMQGIIINLRSGKHLKNSQNILVSMLEKLLSQMDIEEKKRILAEDFGMVMTAELEGRMETMCNLSEIIVEMGIEKGMEQGIKKGMEQGIEQGIEKGIEQERVNAIGRMITAGATKEQIFSYGYTDEEFEAAQKF
ncbi:MAG: hypothetical protein HFH44_00535 [Lachnospiraceae bacterium]|nr:hypothetical protein [Lachnospiraceae bacterium]